jgi:hypothetical protein
MIKMWSAGAFASGEGPVNKVDGPAFASPVVPVGHEKLSCDTPPSAKAVNRQDYSVLGSAAPIGAIGLDRMRQKNAGASQSNDGHY